MHQENVMKNIMQLFQTQTQINLRDLFMEPPVNQCDLYIIWIAVCQKPEIFWDGKNMVKQIGLTEPYYVVVFPGNSTFVVVLIPFP